MSNNNVYRTRSKVPRSQKSSLSNRTLFEYPQNGSRSRGTITFTQHDLNKLKPPQYLNDTVISFFMQYHLDNNVSQQTKDKVYIFDSFFFAKLQAIRTKNIETYEESFKCISKWIKGIEIFKKDFLVMPVCERDHWILVIVCYPERLPSEDVSMIPDVRLYEPAVIVLNSFKSYGPSVKKSLNHFLKYQWMRERGQPRNFSIKSKGGTRLVFPRLPQQSNSYNCGVFALNYFYCFMKDPREAYIRMFRGTGMNSWFEENSVNIPTERKRMGEIIKEQITLWSAIEREALVEDVECQEIFVTSSTKNCGSSIDLTNEEDDKSAKSIPIIQF